ncbi:hypothetical protein F1559_002485 [Cyanidiococcus yangmingshanensis]|uniref:Hint domain-containing protein n=1 Tax=Cyanidiococcus yangmingshanensis TaxID=2690220 RepID=A0A7J7ICR9_9RHOD|nr:hypothetical protein F1559_002485 [Cyanidiococcus yangmingshanensis]
MKLFWFLVLVWFVASATRLRAVYAANCTYYCGGLSVTPVSVNVSDCVTGCSAAALCDQSLFYSVCVNAGAYYYGYRLQQVSSLSEVFGPSSCPGSVEFVFNRSSSDPTNSGTIFNNTFQFGGSSVCPSSISFSNVTGNTTFNDITVDFSGGTFEGSLPSTCASFTTAELILGINGSITVNGNTSPGPAALVYTFADLSLNAAGLCTFEFQQGSSGGGGTKCFSGSAKVLTAESGKVRRMQDLEIGDQVMGVNHQGELVPDQVIGWLHLERSKPSSFLELLTEDGQTVRVTSRHLLYAHRPESHPRSDAKQDWSTFKALYAERLRVGDLLYHGQQRLGVRIVAIRTIHEEGIFAPLTNSGRLVVDGAVVSCYGSFPSHAVAHAVFAPARWVRFRQRNPKWFAPSTETGIMRYAQDLYALLRSIDASF